MSEQPQQPAAAPQSRYQRVKEILDAGAGTSTANYQGKGRFWNLPLPEFLEVVVYGVRMIAPLDESSCDVITAAPAGGAAAVPAGASVDSGCHCGAHDAGAGALAAEASAPADSGCHCGAHDAGAAGDTANTGTAGEATAAPGPATPTAFRQRRQPGRGARSGLIKGLRGQFPFDGSHFPPLLWGAGTVPIAAADIAYIEQWIDDGCPAAEAHDATAVSTRQRALGLEPHPVSLKPTNRYRYEAGEIKQRKNVEFLSPDEIDTLRCAIQLLKSYPDVDHRSFKHWGQIHGDTCQHGWEQFLPWHRIYLYYFEQALQDISPDITLPYWDWTMPQYNQGQVPQGAQGGIIPTIYRCYLTQAGLAALAQQGIPQKYLAALPPVDTAFNSGVDFFAAADKQFKTDPDWLAYRAGIERELGKINPLWHPLRYPAMFPPDHPLAATFHHHYPTADDIAEMLGIPNFRDFGGGTIYDESFGDLDMNPHNTIHIWSGGMNPNYQPANPSWGPSMGDMLNNLTAAYDPIFWGHHSNVDRMWALWQEGHPGLGPIDLTGILAPYAQTVGDVLNIAKLGYEYVKASYLFETEPQQQITQFKSAPVGVHNAILTNHRKAELQLHGIIQPNQSQVARIFINQPDANIHTPIQDNQHYAGYLALFGHGPCIGGPGHCDPPPPRRAYDWRPRPHNAPWKARFDVTDTVRQLVADGATDLDINIVVIGADGREVTDMLRMDAVSLSFKD